MKELKTIHGETLLVDDEDYEKAKQYRWTIKFDKKLNRSQVFTYAGEKRGFSYKRLILNTNSKMTLFKNDNPFDLRRENIMIFDTRSEFVSIMRQRYRKKRTELNFNVSKAAQGKGGKSTKKTTYIGARYERDSHHPWIAFIKHNRKNYYLGCFIKEEYAALAYDKRAREIYGPDAIINFPCLTMEELTEKLEQIKAENEIRFADNLSKRHQGRIFNNVIKTSQYVGVCICRDRKKWRANINYRNKQYFLGNYNTEEEAARAYDEKAIEFHKENAKLNFPRKLDNVKK